MSICYMCVQHEETTHHLFAECKLVKDLRVYIHDEIFKNNVPSQRYKDGDYKLMINTNEDIQWRRLETVTCFVV
jgi:hypothetical protein